MDARFQREQVRGFEGKESPPPPGAGGAPTHGWCISSATTSPALTRSRVVRERGEGLKQARPKPSMLRFATLLTLRQAERAQAVSLRRTTRGQDLQDLSNGKPSNLVR